VALVVGQLEVFDNRVVFVFSSSSSQIHAYGISVYIPACQSIIVNSCAYSFRDLQNCNYTILLEATPRMGRFWVCFCLQNENASYG
jgi:hypothetical protein